MKIQIMNENHKRSLGKQIYADNRNDVTLDWRESFDGQKAN